MISKRPQYASNMSDDSSGEKNSKLRSRRISSDSSQADGHHAQRKRVQRALNRANTNLTHYNRYNYFNEKNKKVRQNVQRPKVPLGEAEMFPRSNSFNLEWNSVFSADYSCLEKSALKWKAFEGELRNCPFRSICWRLFLNLLSTDATLWPNEIRATRDLYESHKSRLEEIQSQPDHPDTTKLKEMTKIISQDVDRSYPDVDYFRLPEVKNTMNQVLLCHAMNEACGYRQGMHEILAVILFTMHCDDNTYKNARDSNYLEPEVIQNLEIFHDLKYVEADAYAMFLKVMEGIQEWYLTVKYSVDGETMEVVQWGQEDMDCFCPGVRYIESIHEDLVSAITPNLYSQLNKLQLTPAIFGLRWIRLMFAHEFPISELLFLWDAIFAAEHSKKFAFVRYLFVALLVHLEEFILQMDFSDALCMLMRIPHGIDVGCLIKHALHYSSPTKFRLPIGPHSCKNQIRTSLSWKRAEETKKLNATKPSRLKRRDTSVDNFVNIYERCKDYIVERTDSFISTKDNEEVKEPKFALPTIDFSAFSPSLRRKSKQIEEEKPGNDICNDSLKNVQSLMSNIGSVLKSMEYAQKADPDQVTWIEKTNDSGKFLVPDLSNEMLQLQRSLTELKDLEINIKQLMKMESETNF